uniref:Uncharacterized protein n=1 Tax=Ascaris lumbricoides TaxID=6252 RepID=A0A0M3IFP3_ASCLU
MDRVDTKVNDLQKFLSENESAAALPNATSVQRQLMERRKVPFIPLHVDIYIDHAGDLNEKSGFCVVIFASRSFPVVSECFETPSKKKCSPVL